MRIERLRAGSILRAVLFVAVLAALGLGAGAAAPTTAMAGHDGDDDDDGPSVSSNFQQCTGGTATADNPMTEAFEQICTITQPSGTCIQRSKEPVVVQMCLVNQGPTPPVMGTARNNNLVVIQIADQRGAEASFTAPLDATQIVDGPLPHTELTRGEQRNFGTANNNAVITQVIIQKLKSGIDDDDDGDDDDDNGEKDEDDDGKEDDDNGEENGPPDLLIEQFEQAHQWVDLCQGGVPCGTAGTPPNAFTGRNRSVVFQSHDQVELAANAAIIDQGQNVEDRDNTCSPGPPVGGTQDPEARACYTIQQDTGNTTNSTSNPANFSRLTQHADHLQNARNCDPCVGGHQAQGHSATFGGIDHNFVQNAPGVARLFSVQEEFMTQRRYDTGAMTHHQVGHIRKGSGTQNTNANNLVDIFQEKTQYTGESELSVQQGSAQAFAQTSGECLADVFVNQNDQSGEAHEGDDTTPGDVCDEFVFCEFGEGCFTSDDVDLLAVRP